MLHDTKDGSAYYLYPLVTGDLVVDLRREEWGLLEGNVEYKCALKYD